MKNNLLDIALQVLSSNDQYHIPESNVYQGLSYLINEYRSVFQSDVSIELFEKKFFIPAIQMGKVSTKDLFIIHEIILFLKYNKLATRYTSFYDIGANIGIHSLIAKNLGFTVTAFEPDPITYNILQEVVKKNGGGVNVINSAVSSFNGKSKFIRCEDNLTASGLVSSTKNFYGKTKSIDVNVIDINDINLTNSIVKIDAEGSELNILSAVNFQNIRNSKFFIEISDENSRDGLWKIFNQKKLTVFSQKIGWEKPSKIDDLPKSWREGSVEVSIV